MGEAKRRKRLDHRYGQVRRLDPQKLLIPFLEIESSFYNPSVGFDFVIDIDVENYKPIICVDQLICRGTTDPEVLAKTSQQILRSRQIFAALMLETGDAQLLPGFVLSAPDKDYYRLPDGLSTNWVLVPQIALGFQAFLDSHPLFRAAIHKSVLLHSEAAVTHAIAYQRRNRLVKQKVIA